MPGVFQWSQTAASNAGADPSVNWAEGQAPSSVNDSARAAMASTAKYRDDISGMLVTGGTSAAYSLTSNQGFDTLANFHNKAIYFTPHVTNAAGPVTMTVDGFANLPLRTSPGKELSVGTIVQGTPYGAIYNNTDGALYLQGYYPAPTTFNIPLAGGMDFWGLTVPNSSFAFPVGQQISQTTYASLYALFGSNRYGTDSGGLFFLPDKTGRVSAMKEATGTRLTTAGSGVDGGTMGSAAGQQSKVLLTANFPPYTPAGTNAPNAGGLSPIAVANGSVASGAQSGASFSVYTAAAGNTLTVPFTGTPQGGTSTPVVTVQPTIVCNYIIRII